MSTGNISASPVAIDPRAYASFWRRGGASLVDSIVIVPILIVVSVVTGMVLPDSWGGGMSESGQSGVDTVMTHLLGAGYVIWFTSRGATLGKRALGILVIGPDGGPPGLARAARRYLVVAGIGSILFDVIWWGAFSGETNDSERTFIGLGILVIYMLVWFMFSIYDVLSMLWHPERRTIHDRIAGTWVIKAQGQR